MPQIPQTLPNRNAKTAVPPQRGSTETPAALHLFCRLWGAAGARPPPLRALHSRQHGNPAKQSDALKGDYIQDQTFLVCLYSYFIVKHFNPWHYFSIILA